MGLSQKIWFSHIDIEERTDNKWKEIVVGYSVLETFHPLTCIKSKKVGTNQPMNCC
jgi:hypothetical protein